MNSNDPNWIKCDIGRNELKTYMKRSDRDGIIWFSAYMFVLVVSGYLMNLSLGSYWVIPAFFVYGSIWCFSNPIGHELSHGTVFRTRWMNEAAFLIVGILNTDEPIVGRWVHAHHHTHTTITGKDPEHLVPNPITYGQYLLEVTGIPMFQTYLKWIVLHSLGIVSRDAQEFVPKSEFRKMFWSSRIIFVFYTGVIVWAGMTQSWWPVIMFVLPRFVGAPTMALFYLTQHAGLAMNVEDFRRNSRTIYMNPLFRFLYWNMNYHIEHHMYPMVPFHALPALHERLKDQMPAANTGMIDTYRDIFHAIRQQKTQPNFVIEKPLPELAAPVSMNDDDMITEMA